MKFSDSYSRHGAGRLSGDPPVRIHSRLALFAKSLTLSLALATPVVHSAQSNYAIRSRAFSSGAATKAANGSVTLRGTIGQPAPQRSTSPNYQVNGGFWRSADATAPAGRIFQNGFEGE